MHNQCWINSSTAMFKIKESEINHVTLAVITDQPHTPTIQAAHQWLQVSLVEVD